MAWTVASGAWRQPPEVSENPASTPQVPRLRWWLEAFTAQMMT